MAGVDAKGMVRCHRPLPAKFSALPQHGHCFNNRAIATCGAHASGRLVLQIGHSFKMQRTPVADESRRS